LIVLRYSVPLFKGVSFILTIPKKLINTETNQYEKSAAKNKTPDEEIVEVDRGQASTTPNTGQTSTPKKSRYIDCFALFRSVIQRCIIYTYYIKKIY
jgi:hypothetical protein